MRILIVEFMPQTYVGGDLDLLFKYDLQKLTSFLQKLFFYTSWYSPPARLHRWRLVHLQPSNF